ncbi:MAG: hypothetical protein KAS04_06050 [Candidatus Aenigmarchaeota archaeon]|nr:hypothetical protein [Candidatus Aenigmarchaeota archaeon]
MMFLVHRDIGLFEDKYRNVKDGKTKIRYYHAEVSDNNPPVLSTVQGVNGVIRFNYGEFTSALFYSFYKKGSWVKVSRGKLLEMYKQKKEAK